MTEKGSDIVTNGMNEDIKRSPAEYQEMCERIVQKAQSLGSDRAEAVVIGGRGISFSFEKNSINKSSSSADFGIGIRILKNKRIGFSYCSREEDAEETIRKALKISRIHEPTEFTFPEKDHETHPPRLSRNDIYDERILEIDAAISLAFVEDMINAALEVDSDILTAEERILVRSSSHWPTPRETSSIMKGPSWEAASPPY